jgi:hypothetical protein
LQPSQNVAPAMCNQKLHRSVSLGVAKSVAWVASIPWWGLVPPPPTRRQVTTYWLAHFHNSFHTAIPPACSPHPCETRGSQVRGFGYQHGWASHHPTHAGRAATDPPDKGQPAPQPYMQVPDGCQPCQPLALACQGLECYRSVGLPVMCETGSRWGTGGQARGVGAWEAAGGAVRCRAKGLAWWDPYLQRTALQVSSCRQCRDGMTARASPQTP